MSTNKKRDVAKDFADFLLKESKGESPLPKTEVLYVLPVDAEKPPEPTAITDLKVTSEVADKSKPVISTERGRGIFGQVSQLVGGVEAIRVAQARILELEKERDTLRDEIERLLVTCEALQRSHSESKEQIDRLDRKQKERLEILEEEKIVINNRLVAREKELFEVKKVNEEMEFRFQNDLKKIRVREREYENKNIILKAESAALARAKDEMILDLRRKLDQIQFEIDNFKNKLSAKDTNLNDIQERQVRAIKALRLALNILESDEQEEKTKKASGHD